jgi:hypothetical protein
MPESVVAAVSGVAQALAQLLAGTNHEVSVCLPGVLAIDDRDRDPVLLANAAYAAAGMRLRVAEVEPVTEPWRDRLHRLVDAEIPTTGSWSSRKPPEVELSADEIERVTALTAEFADIVESSLGEVRQAFEMYSHGRSYRSIPMDLKFTYDMAWHDLLLLTDAWAAVLHVGLSD